MVKVEDYLSYDGTVCIWLDRAAFTKFKESLKACDHILELDAVTKEMLTKVEGIKE